MPAASPGRSAASDSTHDSTREQTREQNRDSNRALTAALAVAAALTFALSFPFNESFHGLWWMSFVWCGLLALASRRAATTMQLIVVVGLPFGLALLAHQWWMREITSLGMPALVLYLTAWFVVLALVLRVQLRAPRPMPMIVVLPTTLVAIEFLRGDLVCGGYAWFYAAHPLVECSTLAQCADLGGSWLVSLLAGLVSGAMCDAVGPTRRARVWSPCVALCAVAAAVVYGQIALTRAPTHEPTTEPQLRVLVVQTNLPMSNKLDWSQDAQVEDFLAFAALTLDGARAATAAGTKADLAIWPETTLPGFGLERGSLTTLVEQRVFPGDTFAVAIADLSRRAGIPLVVGSPAYVGLRVENQRFVWDKQFNSAYLVGEGGATSRTDKIFLTPFGETMPVISNWDWLEQQLLDLGADGMTFDLDRADEPTRFDITSSALAADAPAVRVATPICFEITKPWASRRIAFPNGERAADVLLNLSNDGWFGPSVGGRLQHLQVARLRAIELRTPVVRAVNTGVSASIDSSGRVEASLPAMQAGTLLASVRLDARTPLSVTVGEGVAWSALVMCVVLFARARRRA